MNLPIIQMEHDMKRQMSNYKFIDYFRHSPIKAPSCPKPTTKHKSDKLYTQNSSSRITNKVSVSTHHSPGKTKHDKLLKTSVLNYLHKCRSEYEDNNTNLTQPKSAKQIKSSNVVDCDHKTLKRTSNYKNHTEILDRTTELLGMYRKKCCELQRQKEILRIQAEKAKERVRQLQRNIKLQSSSKQRRTNRQK